MRKADAADPGAAAPDAQLLTVAAVACGRALESKRALQLLEEAMARGCNFGPAFCLERTNKYIIYIMILIYIYIYMIYVYVYIYIRARVLFGAP